MKDRPGSPRRWIFLAALPLVLGLVFWAARWGWAEALAHNPRHQIARWEKAGGMSDPAAGKSVERALVHARAVNPDNARVYLDLGILSELRALRHSPWTPEARNARDQAEGYYREALARRPSWGRAWALLAQSLILNRRFFQGGQEALEKAMVLSPLEEAEQRQVVRFGMSLWERLSEDQRRQLGRILGYALKSQPHATLRVAVKAHREAVVEPMLTDEGLREALKQLVARREQSKKKR